MSLVRVHLTIRGMVQGVGYRYFCYRTALGLGLNGWTRNMPDGSVQVEVEGDRGTVEILIKELTVGPSHANVTNVEPEWREYTGRFNRFEIRG